MDEPHRFFTGKALDGERTGNSLVLKLLGEKLNKHVVPLPPVSMGHSLRTDVVVVLLATEGT
jgi:hypothetical protein